MERLFRSLKTEWVPQTGHQSFTEAKTAILNYIIGYYIQVRPHQHNAGKIRLLIARELVIEGIAADLAEGERYAFVIYMASKGLTLSVPVRDTYLGKITEVVQTVIKRNGG